MPPYDMALFRGKLNAPCRRVYTNGTRTNSDRPAGIGSWMAMHPDIVVLDQAGLSIASTVRIVLNCFTTCHSFMHHRTQHTSSRPSGCHSHLAFHLMVHTPRLLSICALFPTTSQTVPCLVLLMGHHPSAIFRDGISTDLNADCIGTTFS